MIAIASGDASGAMITSVNTFTKASFMRAETFQSIVRTSSPAWYGRTSRNASP